MKLEEAFGELGTTERQLVRAFVARAAYNFPTTRPLLDAVVSRSKLRRICGLEHRCEVPSEASFSRAFTELAASELPQRVHAALLAIHKEPWLAGHLSGDATAVVGRERAVRKPEPGDKAARPARRRWRPRQSEPRPPKPLTRL